MTYDEIIAWLDERILNHRFSALEDRIDKNNKSESDYGRGIKSGSEISNRHFVNELTELREKIKTKCKKEVSEADDDYQFDLY